MDYFVTGGTGFIGRYLIGKLLERDGQIHVLVREGSRGKLEEMRAGFGDEGEKIVPVIGDLSQPMLGVSEPEIEALKGKIGHFFHLAAIYDMEADAEEMRVANVEGTIHAVDLANRLEVGRAVGAAATARTESRGAHTRRDWPDPSPGLRCRLVLSG